MVKKVIILTMMFLVIYLFIGCGVTDNVKGGVTWYGVNWYGNLVERVGETDSEGDLPKTIVKNSDGTYMIFD